MDLKHPLLLQLHAYWDAKRASRPYPSRNDVDPLELKFILGSLILLDIETEPLRYRYRLFGSEIARRQGLDMTGKYSDQHPWAEFAARTREVYGQVVADGQPRLIRRQGVIGDQYVDHQTLVLPLGQSRVEMLLAGVIFTPQERKD
jgi:hypothetical protein